MKIHVCLVMGLLLTPLCIADNDYTGPAVIALSECDCPGIIFGSVGPGDDLGIFNSGMHINSPYNPGGSDGAFDQSGNAHPDIIANYINVVGGIDHHYDWPENVYVHDYTYDITPIPDPYAYLPPHDPVFYSSLPDLGTISTSGTYSPGYYSGGIQVTDIGVTITLQPGDYYLDSVGEYASMDVIGGLITGEGVTLHIVGDADMGVEILGNANIDITAPASGPYEGIAIYQKRNPTYDCAQSCTVNPWLSEFNGTGNIIIDGVVYMPHNRLELGGTGTIELRRVVADRFYVFGTAEKTIGYDGSDYIPGDLIKNGIVDIDDLAFFCRQWGADVPFEFDIYMESNLNYDMTLDLQDFAIFASHWLVGTQ